MKGCFSKQKRTAQDPLLLNDNGCISRHEGLHNHPTQEVCDGADAEDDEIASRLTFESEELHVGIARKNKELAGAILKNHGADTSRHTSNTGDGSNGSLWEHVADRREDVGRPALMGRASNTNQDDRKPRRNGSKRLSEENHQREESKDQHGLHAGEIGILAGSFPP